MRSMAIVSLALLFLGETVAIAQTGQHPPAIITLDATDFITVLKWAFGFGGLLLAAIAALGVTFFGFDVRNARASIDKQMGELRTIIDEVKALRKGLEETTKAQREAQDDIGEIGAKVEEIVEQAPAPAAASAGSRPLPDLIREIVRSGSFEWTTIGRVMKRTALSRDQIMEAVRTMNDIRIGTGKKSKDVIFRFKRQGES
jgi:hypothetical protein